MNKDNGWDASASWNGYMYQGKVALLLTLRNINTIGDVSGYWLESEGIEDFSIGLGEEYKTIHQVKNRKDKNLKDYREALSNIVKRIRDYPKIENGYLHVKNQITITNWDKDINTELLDYYPDKIQRLEKIVACDKIFNEAYDEILEKWNQKSKKFDKRTKDIYKIIIKIMEEENNFENEIDITKDICKIACKKALVDEKLNYDFVEKNDVIKKIKLYDYLKDTTSEEKKNKTFASSSDIIDMTLMEIEKCWGNIAKYRTEKKEIYYMKLLNLINDNITERAEEKSKKIRIPFKEFKEILDKKSDEICLNTKEEELLRLKYLYLKEKEAFCSKNYCEVKSELNCKECKLEEISNIILSYDIRQMEVLFHIMSLHKKDNLTDAGSELFSGTDLKNSFFPEISEIDKNFFVSEYKVLSRADENFMMATTIDADRKGIQEDTIIGLVQNDIQDICKNIIDNNDNDIVFMEVDKLITRNFDTENIFKEAQKINLITDDFEEDDLKYVNITKTKKVGLISIKNAKLKYGERK